MLCVSDVQRYASSLDSLTKYPEMCKAYSFFSIGKSSVCELYNGASVTKISDPRGAADVTCYNLTVEATEFHETTHPPPNAAEMAHMDSMLPKLNLAMDAHSADILTFVSPDNCFETFNWITLQEKAHKDKGHKAISVSVKESEWVELLALIPVDAPSRLLTSSQDLAANVFSDRVVIAHRFAAPGVTPPPPTCPDVCPWRAGPTDADNIILCTDGAYVTDWSCWKNGHGQRAKCPRNKPKMCAHLACANGKEYCCAADCEAASCHNCGGDRICERDLILVDDSWTTSYVMASIAALTSVGAFFLGVEKVKHAALEAEEPLE